MEAMGHLLTVLRDPVALILVAAGVVELFTGGTVARGAILFAGSALILADRVRTAWAAAAPGSTASSEARAPIRFPAAGAQRVLTSPYSLGIALVAAAAAALFDVHTFPLTAIVGITGVIAVGWAWSTEAETTRKKPSWLGLLPWGGLFLALGLWELTALLGQPSLDQTSYDSPTISYLMEPVVDSYPGRVAVLGLWVGAGRNLVRRS